MANDVNPEHPLDEGHLAQLQEAIDKTGVLERAIQKAKLAGVDVGDAFERNRATREKLVRVKQTYFPGR